MLRLTDKEAARSDSVLKASKINGYHCPKALKVEPKAPSLVRSFAFLITGYSIYVYICVSTGSIDGNIKKVPSLQSHSEGQ